jgi:uncharacterized protein YdhG (YjbR/CyaY superfamily)
MGKPTTVDDYLAILSDDKRAALEKLRRVIKSAAPRAEECISYQLPAFRQNGMLVAFGATGKHCAFYPMSSSTVAAYGHELKDYDTSKGTIRFQPEKPLPAALVRKLVRARLEENATAQDNKTAKQKQKPKPKATAGRTTARPRARGPRTDSSVDEFMRDLDHPLKHDIEVVRQVILSLSPEITEAIKWNGPSFRTTDFFATVNLRSRDRVQLIFHRGAKVKDNSTKKVEIADPAGLIKWLATDRCLVTLGTGNEINANRPAFESIVRQWLRTSPKQ